MSRLKLKKPPKYNPFGKNKPRKMVMDIEAIFHSHLKVNILRLVQLYVMARLMVVVIVVTLKSGVH
jgi:hypothetical protein